MLRALQVFVLSCCLASLAAAAPITVGLRAGSSVPNLRDNGGNDFSKGWSTRVGLFLGASAAVHVTPALSVQAELNYSQQGAKKNGMQAVSLPDLPLTLFADIKNTAKLDYLEVPVLARYELGPARSVFLTLGPYAGFLLSAKNVTSGVSTVYFDKGGTTPFPFPPDDLPLVADFGATTDNKSSLHGFNWGIQGGVGVARPLGTGDISLELRGELGLMNLQKHPDVDGKNSTGALILALGYGLRLGR
jgi:hypothetical protein